MAQTLKDSHKEAIRVFREVLAVEKALIQRIVTAVPAPYLSAIRNRQSNAFNGALHQIVTYLQDTYGRVTPQVLQEELLKVQQLVYDPTQPIDTVFAAVEDLNDFAELAQSPFSQKQTINLAYIIINKCGRFPEDIKNWNKRPIVEQTWINFKNSHSSSA